VLHLPLRPVVVVVICVQFNTQCCKNSASSKKGTAAAAASSTGSNNGGNGGDTDTDVDAALATKMDKLEGGLTTPLPPGQGTLIGFYCIVFIRIR
jgi:hypothetical protein